MWYSDSVCSGKLMMFGFVSRIGCVMSRRYWILRCVRVSLGGGVVEGDRWGSGGGGEVGGGVCHIDVIGFSGVCGLLLLSSGLLLLSSASLASFSYLLISSSSSSLAAESILSARSSGLFLR